MRIVDAHVHLYPPELNRGPAAWAAAQGEMHWAKLCTRVRRDGRGVQAFPTVEELVRAMDAAGVAQAVLLGWYWEKHSTCVWQNRFYAECVRAFPDRLAAMGTIHVGAGRQSVGEEVRRLADEGFVGLGELSPHSQGWRMDDPVWLAMVGLAGELGLAINLHVTESASGSYPGKVETPAGDFVTLAQAYPRTRFVLAHLGARLALDPLFGAQVKACGNVFYDLAAVPLIYGVESGAVVLAMVEAVGPERVLFGTDFPLVLYPQKEIAPGMGGWLEALRGSGLTETELAQICGGNAARVIKPVTCRGA